MDPEKILAASKKAAEAGDAAGAKRLFQTYKELTSSTKAPEVPAVEDPTKAKAPFAVAPSPSLESPSSVSPSTSVGVVGQSVAPDGQKAPKQEIDGSSIASQYIKSSQDLKKWRDYRSSFDVDKERRAVGGGALGLLGGIMPQSPEYKSKVEEADKIVSAFEKSHAGRIAEAENYINQATDKYVSSDSKIGYEQAKLLMTKDAVGTPVVDVGKIRAIAESEARKLGVEGTEFEKLYYNKLKQKVDYAFAKPTIESLYEKNAKKAYEESGIDFTEDDKLYASTKSKIDSLNKNFDSEKSAIRGEIESAMEPVRQSFAQERASIDAGYNQSLDNIQQRLNAGIINQDAANIELANLNQGFKQKADEYNQRIKAVQEDILKGYNSRFTKLQKDYMADRELALDQYQRQIAAIEQKWKDNPELKEKLQKAYKDASNQVFGVRENIREDLADPNLAGLASFFKNTGSMIKSMSAAFGEDIGPMYEIGDWLENRYVAEEVDLNSFKSWVPGGGLGTLTGQLLATMGPAAGAAAIASTGFGTPVAGGLASAVMNAWQVAGSAREDVFNRTGDVVAADKAGTETLKSQIAYLPLSYIEGLPFAKGFTMIPSKLPVSLARAEKALNMGLKGTVELAAETIQEKFEGSTEKSVLENGGAFDKLGEDLMNFDDWKRTFIAVGPAGFLGAAGGFSDPTRRGLANEFLAQRAADKVSDSYKNAWVLKGVFDNPGMTRGAIDVMFANGGIDENQRTQLINKLDAAINNKAQAERLGLDGQRQYIYTAMSGELDGLRAKLEAEQDPVAKKVLEDRMKTASQGLVDFANNKGGAYYTITMTNGVPMVQTEEGMTRLLGDQQFIDGALGSSNISIQSFGKADPAVQKRVQELIKKQQQLKTQTDAVQKRTAAQMGAQPLGAEGAGQEGGEGVGPRVQGPKAPETLTEEEVAVVAPGRSELSSVLASVRGAEYVNENRLAAAEDELYSIFDDIESREDLTPEQKGQMQAAVERSIQTLQDYGFRTRTETRTATQAVAVRTPKQAPKAARRGATPIAAAADEGISITYDDGVSGPKQGVVKKENGQYVFYQKPMGAVKKFKPVVIGDAAIVDGSVQFAGIENRTTGPLASVANITLPGGKKITILDDDLSIDAAIHVAKLELGEIPQDEFDIEFQTIVTENNIEVPYIYEPKPAAKPAPKPVAEPVTVAEPKAKTVALFQKLAKLRDNLKGTTHAGTKNKTQKEIDDILRENPKLAEVSAKFDEAVKQLEDAQKLKVRCP